MIEEIIQIALWMTSFLCISFVLSAPFVWIASWAFIKRDDAPQFISGSTDK